MESQALAVQARFVWTRFVMMAVGLWLIVTPATFNEGSNNMTLNDIVCGLLTITSSFLALSPYRLWAPWLISAIGVWLQLAPLIFWAPTAVSYLNDTACGALLVLLAVIIPGTPGGIEPEGAEIPSGWSYNPSSWLQRLPVIALAFLAWMSARYMAAYQLGYIDSIWDPFFPRGTLSVITSPLSQSFPVSDAGLGAFVYTMEVLMGFKGRTRRWYTMPWIVFLFGIMVVPAGMASIILIMLQPLIVGFWCTWCLFTAVCMLLMIALTVDEVVAVCQYLASVKKEGLPFWKTFWKGGEFPQGPLDDRSPPLNSSTKNILQAMTWGITVPWNLLLSIVLGAALMFGPSYLNLESSLANDDYIIGALVATVSFIAMAEVARAARFINVVLGIWVLFFTLLYGHGQGPLLYHVAWSLLIIGLSIPKGKILERYGTWDRYIV